MYLDADDLVDSRVVATARESIVDQRTAGIVTAGVAIDYPSGNALVLPDPRLGGLHFHEVCGSSTVACIDPGASDLVRRDPHAALGSHHEWHRSAARAGLDLARLPVCGGYFVNTSESHSEHYGPSADWKREFARRVAKLGSPIAPEHADQLGLDAEFPMRSLRGAAWIE